MADGTIFPGKWKNFTDDEARGLIAGFFDGVQIDPASTETGVSRGYAQ